VRFLEDLLNIIYPRLCSNCGEALTKNEELLCFSCRSQLPRISFSDFLENELVDRFYGKLDIKYAAALLYFYKSGITQNIMHQFKYKGHLEIGVLFGKWLGFELVAQAATDDIDLIVPVPLHPKKQRKRGYNQSHHIAQGLSDITNIPTGFDLLIRVKYQKSQTQKSKEQRWQNVKDAFELLPIKGKEGVSGKHILLVDDIITTGATLEACGRLLLENNAAKISIATIALAK